MNSLVILVLASIISSYGLLVNSHDAVIGSMILSSLLAPLFDRNLSKSYSFLLIVSGIVITIFIAYFIGQVSQLTPVITQEMQKFLGTPHWQFYIIPFVSGILLFMAYRNKFKSIASHLSVVGTSVAVSVLPPLCATGLYLNLQQLPQAYLTLQYGLLNIFSIFGGFVMMKTII